MAEITIVTVPLPSAVDWYGWPWVYVGPIPPEPDPTINLLSATPDGPRDLVLVFDRAPAGDALLAGAYALSTGGAGLVPDVVSAVREPDAFDFSRSIRLRFARGGTAGEDYTVTASGITGPSGEALGTAAATWTAPVPAAVRVLGAYWQSSGRTLLEVDSDLYDDADLRNGGNYAIAAGGHGPVTVSSASLHAARAILLAHTPLDAGTAYLVTVTDGQVESLDGGTIDEPDNTASVDVPAAAATPPAPPALRVTWDGAPLDVTMTLLPRPGEPESYDVLRALWISLFTNRLAAEGDVLPDDLGDPPDRGGWWGDSHAAVKGDRWGSRWWLLARYRGPDAAALAEEWGLEALAWAVEDRVLDAAPVIVATRVDDRLDVSIRVLINDHVAELLYDLWGGA